MCVCGCVHMLDKELKYRKKHLYEWINEACSKKHFECSVRVEKCCISTSPFTRNKLIAFGFQNHSVVDHECPPMF